jgi:hypothetical protein
MIKEFPAPKMSFFKDFFLWRRRPKFLGEIKLAWERPQDPAEYQRSLKEQGFINTEFWQGKDPQIHQTILIDLDNLEQYLLPLFFELNQKARYYQNQFYVYQWIFILGAFLTTFVGILTTYSFSFADNQTISTISGFVTAAIAAITTVFTALSNRGEPQKRWAKTRRLTEELRIMYFKYLAHVAPFDQTGRVQRLREMMLSIRAEQERENA